MDIAFRARNVDVPESLRRVTREKVTRLAAQCGLERADVCFSVARNPRIAEREMCAITLFGSGRILRAQAAATELSVAADRVVGQLEQRANRLRGRLDGRRWRPRTATGVFAPCAPPVGAGSVHFPTNWSALGRTLSADPRGDAGGSHREPMTPEEAALEMGEQDSDNYFFLNAETGRQAALYRRLDGDIVLADPAPATARAGA